MFSYVLITTNASLDNSLSLFCPRLLVLFWCDSSRFPGRPDSRIEDKGLGILTLFKHMQKTGNVFGMMSKVICFSVLSLQSTT